MQMRIPSLALSGFETPFEIGARSYDAAHVLGHVLGHGQGLEGDDPGEDVDLLVKA